MFDRSRGALSRLCFTVVLRSRSFTRFGAAAGRAGVRSERGGSILVADSATWQVITSSVTGSLLIVNNSAAEV